MKDVSPDIGNVEMLTKEVDSHLVFRKGYVVAKKKRKDMKGCDLVLLVRIILKFRKLLVGDGHLRHSVVGKITVRDAEQIFLIIHDPRKDNYDEPDRISKDNQKNVQFRWCRRQRGKPNPVMEKFK